ncbi:MAG: ribosome silencing factor [Planctomycetota bacterium]
MTETPGDDSASKVDEAVERDGPSSADDLVTDATFESRATGDPEAVRAFAIEAARLAKDDKCFNVCVLDVTSSSQVTEYIVLASGTSERQMRSTLDHIAELGESRGASAFRVSRDDSAYWLLADFVDVVVHLFEPNARAYYDLEMLWGDAPRVDWRRPGEADTGVDPETGVGENG